MVAQRFTQLEKVRAEMVRRHEQDLETWAIERQQTGEHIAELERELADVTTEKQAAINHMFDEGHRVYGELDDAHKQIEELKDQLAALHSFAGVRTLLQSILDEAYPPNTIVCSDKADADVGAQLTAAARKILQLEAQLTAERDISTAQAELIARIWQLVNPDSDMDGDLLAELRAQLPTQTPTVPIFCAAHGRRTAECVECAREVAVGAK